MPASFFAIVLGIAGLAADWRAAHAVWALPAVVGESLYAIASVAWLVITTLYVLKWLVAPADAKAESRSAIQCCYIGLAGVATLLIAQGVLPYVRAAAVTLFLVGVTFLSGFAVWRTGSLWQGGRDPASNTPVLYLPLVAGGFVTGTLCAALGWRDWGQLAFGVGFFTWLGIESVLIHRLYTAEPLPAALRPTLGIQLAPPAVGALCYVSIREAQLDLLAYMLIGYALVQAVLLLRLIPWIAEQPFGPSYWAFTFGITALAGAATRLYAVDHSGAIGSVAPFLFVSANLIVLTIALATLRLIVSGRLLPQDGWTVRAPPGTSGP
jgi:tellurite resistance protein